MRGLNCIETSQCVRCGVLIVLTWVLSRTDATGISSADCTSHVSKTPRSVTALGSAATNTKPSRLHPKHASSPACNTRNCMVTANTCEALAVKV